MLYADGGFDLRDGGTAAATALRTVPTHVGPPRTSRCVTSAATGPGSALGHFPSASPAVKPHQGSAWDSAGEGERRTLRGAPRAFLALLDAPEGAELAAE